MKAKIEVPNTLNDVSLKQYQQYMKVQEGLSGEFLDQKTIEIFCGVSLRQILFIKRKSIVEILDHINTLFKTDYPLVRTFKIKDQEFGFIPNLDEITQGEYADLDTYINSWEDMHKAMAVLYRPIKTKSKDKYTVVDYSGSSEFSDLMSFMPLDIAMGAVVFFYHLGNELLNSTQRYLVEEVESLTIQHSHSLKMDGDGIIQSMHLLRETLESSTRSLKSHFTSALPISPTLNKKTKQNENSTVKN